MFHNYRMGVFVLQTSVCACGVTCSLKWRMLLLLWYIHSCSLLSKPKPDVILEVMYVGRLIQQNAVTVFM
jgi:hypothetical protein